MDSGYLQGNHVNLGNIVSEIKAKIMYRIIEDTDIAKLLYYNTADALHKEISQKQIQELFLQKGDNEHRRIYLKPYPNQVTFIKDCELRIHIVRITVPTAPYVYQPTIQIDIFCHNDLTDLDDGLSQRQDILLQKINDLLENYHLGVVGNMHLVRVDDWSMNNSSYLGYSMVFTTGTVNI